ncbi:MAG: manganese efflux pump [Alphaproteobacteria bacterium]|nr:MAG: manganese efflux pump [Alphaproteobacteria bacterium]
MAALIFLALALAMDAFAAALCQGAVVRSVRGEALRIGGAFGLALGLMPLIGWSFGLLFATVAASLDHWLALVLLGGLGIKMLREGLAREEGDCPQPIRGWALLVAAIATSVDAAAAGVTLPLLGQPVLLACAVIGTATAILCAAGVHIGAAVGARLGKPAELAGGAVLILLGVKIFVQHQFLGG